MLEIEFKIGYCSYYAKRTFIETTIELKENNCCNVVITQINYPNLNKQDSTEQVRGLCVK